MYTAMERAGMQHALRSGLGINQTQVNWRNHENVQALQSSRFWISLL